MDDGLRVERFSHRGRLFLFAALSAFAEHPIPPATEVAGFVEINEILCENPRYVMDFAAALSRGDASERAKDTIGKQAHREVCGRFIGLAAPGQATVATSDGVVYQLIAFRFKEDDRADCWRNRHSRPAPAITESTCRPSLRAAEP